MGQRGLIPGLGAPVHNPSSSKFKSTCHFSEISEIIHICYQDPPGAEQRTGWEGQTLVASTLSNPNGQTCDDGRGEWKATKTFGELVRISNCKHHTNQH